jgi:hypothetical protein
MTAEPVARAVSPLPIPAAWAEEYCHAVYPRLFQPSDAELTRVELSHWNNARWLREHDVRDIRDDLETGFAMALVTSVRRVDRPSGTARVKPGSVSFFSVQRESRCDLHQLVVDFERGLDMVRRRRTAMDRDCKVNGSYKIFVAGDRANGCWVGQLSRIRWRRSAKPARP